MDALFKGRQASDSEITAAKKAYRKLYLKAYFKTYAKANVQISFRVSIAEYKLLKDRSSKQGIKVPALVKQTVLRERPSHTIDLKVLCLEMIDDIELLVYQGSDLDIQKMLNQLNNMLKLIG